MRGLVAGLVEDRATSGCWAGELRHNRSAGQTVEIEELRYDRGERCPHDRIDLGAVVATVEWLQVGS